MRTPKSGLKRKDSDQSAVSPPGLKPLPQIGGNAAVDGCRFMTYICYQNVRYFWFIGGWWRWLAAVEIANRSLYRRKLILWFYYISNCFIWWSINQAFWWSFIPVAVKISGKHGVEKKGSLHSMLLSISISIYIQSWIASTTKSDSQILPNPIYPISMHDNYRDSEIHSASSNNGREPEPILGTFHSLRQWVFLKAMVLFIQLYVGWKVLKQ